MAAQEATPGSQSEGSFTLDLPSWDLQGYNERQRPSQEDNSEALSSVESYSFPCSSDLESDSKNLNTQQEDCCDSKNSWLDPSLKDQLETKEEDDGLRKSLDRFYEVFSHPLPGSGDQLSVPVCHCLSQKIIELSGQETHKYALRSFQMARVIFNRDGCSVLQRHSKDIHFYPLEEGGSSGGDKEPTPGLSKEIIHFVLQQTFMKDS
uniref:shieldin complex subunit 1 n=1 Tax=Jaculus jaculus TaxID=51337 RepID=UPI000333285A|nr:shieldin complex subunit 1 [Jaculus jaculus]XP_045012806.1 shieldin complex subunit 1 [Jaculus jaculus]XP_045012807.1 shieldin complex subunit 1 [Jaculus jaculus]XP_045012808.1 shieldin complex subunit 1 [Jaculus jaculus]